MLDVFRLTHNEIIDDGRLKPLSDTALQHAKHLAQLTFDPATLPGRELVEGSRFFDDYAKFYVLTCNTHLRQLGRLFPIDKIFLETVLLHKLQLAHPHDKEQPFDYNFHFITLGCMAQRKLGNLILQLKPKGRFDAFDFGQTPGIDRHIWETAFIGASSCVRVMKAAGSIPELHIRSSMLTEDITYGIDLFLETDNGTRFCVSVKSGNREASMSAQRIKTGLEFEPEFSTLDQIKISNGTTRMKAHLAKKDWFIPYFVRVGKQPGRQFDLELYPDDIECIRSFLENTQEPLKQNTTA